MDVTNIADGTKASVPIEDKGSNVTIANYVDDLTCYCGNGRDLRKVELQCVMCLRYYHQECITCLLGNVVSFMTNYQFYCKRCSPSQTESFSKKAASFNQMCYTAVANLAAQDPSRRFFSKDKEIIPFIDEHWEALTTGPRRVKLTWHTTIAKTMFKDTDLFLSQEQTPGDVQFAVIDPDLTKIGPNFEFMLKMSSTFRTPSETKTTTPAPVEARGRGSKRKALEAPAQGRPPGGRQLKKNNEIGTSARIVPTCFPSEHPFNKDGYRYQLAEPDPHAPNWPAFDSSTEWAGKPIPGYLYRLFLEQQVQLSLHDKAPQLKLSDDRLTVTGEKGYCMIRATHGVSTGSWYFEVTIKDMPAETACRIGWSQYIGNLQAPCGYDKFSYSWRSRKGTRFHESRGKHYADEGYKEKDVVGFYIKFPYPSDLGYLTPRIYKNKPLVKFKNLLYYEEKDFIQDAEKNLKCLKGSQTIMFKNGVCQGEAFTDLNEGYYYPAISLYKNITVQVNFGPTFKYPPKGYKYRPISDLSHESVISHAVGDMLYHVEHENNLPAF